MLKSMFCIILAALTLTACEPDSPGAPSELSSIEFHDTCEPDLNDPCETCSGTCIENIGGKYCAPACDAAGGCCGGGFDCPLACYPGQICLQACDADKPCPMGQECFGDGFCYVPKV